MSTPTFNLQVGQEVLLKGSVLDQNSNQLVYSGPQVAYMGAPAAISYASSDTSIATVSSGPGNNFGLVYGVAAGSATITASYTDAYGNEATQEIDITVYLPAATSIQLVYPGSSTAG